MLKKISLITVFTALLACTLSGCSAEQDNICANPEVKKKLRYDFGYEIASNTSLPQMEFSRFKLQRAQNLVTYCSARAEISGTAEGLLNVLIAKLGSRNFRAKQVSLRKVDPVTLTHNQVQELYPYLAVFYLHRYKSTLPKFKTYKMVMQVDYTVNNQNYYLSGVDYDADLFRMIFKVLSNDLESSQRDLPVISVLRR